MQINDIIDFLESWAPLTLQESYDNSGLIIGERSSETSSALITLDVTEPVIGEAIDKNCNLIIAHHPMIFSGIKRIGNTHWLDKCIRKAIKHDLNIYAIHTNLDNIIGGVNYQIAKKIGLKKLRVLSPKPDTLLKLTVFVPPEAKDQLLERLFAAGAGKIGNYDHCSFQLSGEGTFRPNDEANPTIGVSNRDETVRETRVEVIMPAHRKLQALDAMYQSHPYEEVAYYLSALTNDNQETGAGMTGELNEALPALDFLNELKKQMGLQVLKHTKLVKAQIGKIAVCGGAGSFLLHRAISAKADVFISADFKYHDYFEANDRIIIADIGHYESEVHTKNLIHERLSEKFPNFAFRLSEVNTNPVKFL